MADFENNIAEQLRVLNENLSLKGAFPNKESQTNFAEHFAFLLDNLTRQVNNLAVNVHKLENKLDSFIKP